MPQDRSSIPPEAFCRLLQEAGFDFITGVPDSTFGGLIDHLPQSGMRHVSASCEGEGCALAVGYHLGTGRRAVVYLQNSGLGNCVNPLTSLLDPAVYAIPVLLLVGWRGRPGQADEPQHARMGLVTEELLRTLGVAWSIAPSSVAEMADRLRDVNGHFDHASAPYAMLFPSGVIERTPAATPAPDDGSLMTREEAIETIVDALPAHAVVVCTTGKASRELYEIRARRTREAAMDFFTVGAMGFAVAIAHGIALAQPSRPVFAIDGDGAALMHMGVFATVGHYRASGLVHLVIDNGLYESTGGATVSPSVRFDQVARGCSYASAVLVSTAVDLQTALAANVAGPRLIVIHVAPGSRPDLGRPRTTPAENKGAFMAYLAQRISL